MNKKTTKNVVFSVSFPKELKEKLELKARENNVACGFVIREALYRFLKFQQNEVGVYKDTEPKKKANKVMCLHCKVKEVNKKQTYCCQNCRQKAYKIRQKSVVKNDENNKHSTN
jgi:hypothetical protein